LVFAGNIGAENRYEYTVIGDPVNEAARIADYAKGRPNRVVSSGSALAQAGRVEQEHWTMQSSAVLRGRSAVTQLAEPQSAD
jgi:class 3 adenylate cyclase